MQIQKGHNCIFVESGSVQFESEFVSIQPIACFAQHKEPLRVVAGLVADMRISGSAAGSEVVNALTICESLALYEFCASFLGLA